MTLPALFLRIESLVVFACATTAYFAMGYDGWLYLLLFFSFDVSAIGYVVNARVGALTYNAIHNYAPAIGLFVLGAVLHAVPAEAYALLWIAHVGFDRTIGFGLMYPDRFGDTNIAVIPRLRELLGRTK